MAIFIIETAHKEMQFREENFGIAQAVFNVLASRSDLDDVRLIVEDGYRVLICNKAEYQDALRAHRTQAARSSLL
jgi:hypothetical protein